MYSKRGWLKGTTSNKHLTSNSTGNSLTRLRQSSGRAASGPFRDIAGHIKKCKETCNSVSKRLDPRSTNSGTKGT